MRKLTSPSNSIEFTKELGRGGNRRTSTFLISSDGPEYQDLQGVRIRAYVRRGRRFGALITSRIGRLDSTESE